MALTNNSEVEVELGKTTTGYLIGAWYTATFVNNNASKAVLEELFNLATNVMEGAPQTPEGTLVDMLQGASFLRDEAKKFTPLQSGYKGEGDFGVSSDLSYCAPMKTEEAVAVLSIARRNEKGVIKIIARKDVNRIMSGEDIDAPDTQKLYRAKYSRPPSDESADHQRNALD